MGYGSFTMTNKKFISLRYWLLGRKYFKASLALEYAAGFHTGTRKDGKTPEYDHQVSMAHLIRTFVNHLNFPEETLAATCLHDTAEDYDLSFDEIRDVFGKKVSKAVKLLTKKHRGTKVPPEVYYAAMADNPIASIVKGVDRINNISTMVDVFTHEKQEAYIEETQNLILPMLKKARRQFQEQEGAYENVKYNLELQIKLIQQIHKARKYNNESHQMG